MNEEKIEVVEEIDTFNFELMHDGKGEDEDEQQPACDLSQDHKE